MFYLLKNQGLFKMLGLYGISVPYLCMGSVLTVISEVTLKPYSTRVGGVSLCHRTHENKELPWASHAEQLC